MKTIMSDKQGETGLADFRNKATLGLALVALVFLIPFSINNFIQQRYGVGVGSLTIVTILALNCWSLRCKRHPTRLITFALVPAIIVVLVFSLRHQGIIGVLWCYPALLSFYMMLPERGAWLANGALLIITSFQAWWVLDASLAIRMTATLLVVSVFSMILIRVITEQQQRLRQMVITDPLTGTLNRTLLGDTLQQAIQRASRTGAPMTLLALDLDHFKKVNDTHGHGAGDRVLRGLGRLLEQRCRRTDRVFRLGGEEFLIFLPDTDADGGYRVAEELRAAIAALELLPDHPITASLGMATLRPMEDWRVWIKRADERLYRAKLLGRNRVVACDTTRRRQLSPWGTDCRTSTECCYSTAPHPAHLPAPEPEP